LEKKLILVLSLAASLAGCAGWPFGASEPSDRGWVPRTILDEPLYAPFRIGYDTSQVAKGFVDLIREARDGIEVTVFFGGWCSDSKREVPRFLKLADSAGIPPDRVRLYALDRTMKSSDGMADKYGIERVPTFIFMKNGEEIGRITESPRTTMEADVLTILAVARTK